MFCSCQSSVWLLVCFAVVREFGVVTRVLCSCQRALSG